jgi:transcriptional regulator of NAD metabolism
MGRVGDALQKFLENLKNSNAEALNIDEDEFVEHLQTCPNGRKHVADLARAGVKLSARVLSAAGVEMLN